MSKWYFCKHCGYSCCVSLLAKILSYILGYGNPKICRNCNIKLSELPFDIQKKYSCFGGEELFSDKWLDSNNKFVEEYVSTFPEFNNNLYVNENNRLQETIERHFQYQEEKQKEYIEKINMQTQKILDKQNCLPKCPICGSTNVNKITLTKRAVKTATFGVIGAIDDAGKTYQCGNCHSKF